MVSTHSKHISHMASFFPRIGMKQKHLWRPCTTAASCKFLHRDCGGRRVRHNVSGEAPNRGPAACCCMPRQQTGGGSFGRRVLCRESCCRLRRDRSLQWPSAMQLGWHSGRGRHYQSKPPKEVPATTTRYMCGRETEGLLLTKEILHQSQFVGS